MGRAKPLVLSALALLCAAGVLAVPATAAEEHLYDPVLSLTGSTVTTTEDPVPDPGSSHPTKAFNTPCSVATDPRGYIYVTNPKLVLGSFAGVWTAVFNPQGEFLTEFEHSFNESHCGLAVDSGGNVYSGGVEGNEMYLYEPSSYPPTAATAYSLVDTFDPFENGCSLSAGTAIDPSNDHFYIAFELCAEGTDRFTRFEEYGSAAEGSVLIKQTLAPLVSSKSIDVYGKSHDVYILRTPIVDGTQRKVVIEVRDGSDGSIKCELKGEEIEGLPGGNIGSGGSIAVDQSNGDVYLYAVAHGIVFQFAVSEGDECEFTPMGQLPSKPPILSGNTTFNDIEVDSPIEAGEAEYESPNEGYVYVTSGTKPSDSHLFAFRPKLNGPPLIEEQEAIEVGETEAVLQAQLNPNALATTYRFEYTTQATFDEVGYSGAAKVPVPDKGAGEGGAFVAVSEPISGLQPDTAYRFRLVASNCEAEGAEPGECETLGEGNPGAQGEDASFATYPAGPEGLPEDRAYELVTPPDTNGRAPVVSFLTENNAEIMFATAFASPNGESVVFGSNMGALPGLGGGGYRDLYRARRDPAKGWQSHFTGLSGAQATHPRPGGVSADHGYSFWNVEPFSQGTLVRPKTLATYMRVPPGVEPSPNCAPEAEPDAGLEWIGCGSLGFDAPASGRWISPDGEHVIFQTGSGSIAPVQLEPCAPPDGIRAVYDRTPGGSTRCISVPPAGASPELQAQFESNSHEYKGANRAGTAVAFEVAETLYVRLSNTDTVAVAEGGPILGGISSDGGRVFYLKGAPPGGMPRGEIFLCEVSLGPCAGPEATQEPLQIGAGGESVVVNVSADGSHLYFSSPVVLTAGEENGQGEKAQAGEDNLYLWDGEAVRFIAVLGTTDLTGEGDPYQQGLGKWIAALGDPLAAKPAPGMSASRTTPDGEVLAFLSHAELTGSEGNGHWQLYRYDAQAQELRCLSCNPTAAAAASDARLQATKANKEIFGVHVPIDLHAQIPNLTDDGQRVFFESGERLVPADLDGRVDVYGWRAQGTGSCKRAAGCLGLISGAKSAEDEHLYAMTPDASDLFFYSADTLVPQDPDSTPSIYDARVGGGFPPPEPPPGDCLGEACQPAVAAPDDATPSSAAFKGQDNPRAGRDCGAIGRRVGKLSHRAKALRSRAKAARSPKRAKRMRRKAKRLSRKANTLGKRAKRCRRDNRRAAR